MDTIPSRTSYVDGSLITDGGSGHYDDAANAIRWTGTVSASDAIHIQYAVMVASTPGTPFYVLNEAQVSGGAANLASLPDLTAMTLVQNEIGLALEEDEQQIVESGSTAVFKHTLTNKGNFTDTFDVDSDSSQGWITQTPAAVTLGPGQAATVQVSLAVPDSVVSGTVDTMIVTATSAANGSFSATVTDETTVWKSDHFVYVPLVMKE